jgi:hypothetical protein
MKRIDVFTGIWALFSISGFAIAQAIIENPAKPDNPRAGRTVTLQEVMRIEDSGKDFYIKYVAGLWVSPDGPIIVNDSGDQALQFDARGRFIRNLMKKGQGPGELTDIYDIGVSGDRIYLLGSPAKILIFDLDGVLQREFSLKNAAPMGRKLIAVDGVSFILTREGLPDLKTGTGWVDFPQEIISVMEEGGKAKVLSSFPLPRYQQVVSNAGVAVTAYQQFLAVADRDISIFLSHTPEYLVKLFNRATSKVIKQYRRPYSRIEANKKPPTPKYWPDIIALHVVEGKIWVQTSTVDAHKGILFDAFDKGGRYLDRFYLKWSDKEVDPNRVWQKFTFAGGFVYFADKTADDLVVIKKCRLVGL